LKILPLDPPRAQVRLLGRGPGLRRLACDGSLSAKLELLLGKRRLRLPRLNTAPVVRRVVFPESAGLGLFMRDRATTRKL
jgi:hypothetical protein